MCVEMKKIRFIICLLLIGSLFTMQMPAILAKAADNSTSDESQAVDYSTPEYSKTTGVNSYSGTIPLSYFGDVLYYNVGDLTTNQINSVSNSSYFSRGTVLVYKVDGTVVVGAAAEELLINNQVKTVVIPGVGSSPYGSLAMAKQFSKIMNRPVASIVAGVGGLEGVMIDGPEGYFLGRNANKEKMSYDYFGSPGLTAFDGGYAWRSLWNVFHWINYPYTNGDFVGVGDFKFYVPWVTRNEWYSVCGWQGIGAVWKSTSSTTSKKLANLMEAGFKPEYVIGHSKGDMDAANAFFILKENGKSALYQGVKFVGFGMTVNLPAGIKSVQYLGSRDNLGGLNSVREASPVTNDWVITSGPLVDEKMHSLNQNTLIAPNAMPVGDIMTDVKAKLSW